MNQKNNNVLTNQEYLYENINNRNIDIIDLQEKYLEVSYEIANGINFIDNYWDFSNIINSKNNSHRKKYRFDDILTTKYRFYLKKLVLRQLFTNESRPNTVYGKYSIVKNFIKYLENEVYLTVPTSLYDQVVQNFINKYKKENYKRRIRMAIKEFLSEIEKHEDFNLNEFRSLFSNNVTQIYAENEIGKTPNIPDRLFNKIIQLALIDLENKELNLIDRMTAGLILLLSQIGLRIGEALILEIGKLKEESIFDGKKKAYKLEFWTYKTTGIKDGKWTITFMTPLAIRAYKTLEELGASRRKNGSLYLYPNPYGDMYSSSVWGNNSLRFFIRNQKNLELNEFTEVELNQILPVKINNIKAEHIGILNRDDIGKVFYKVNAHQYRVAVCNHLRKKSGINLQWIKKHMNHLEEDMTKHYFRDDNIAQQTLLKRVSSEGDLLETNKENVQDEEIRKELDDPYFVEAYNTINKFLKKKKFKIYKDLDHIINTFKTSPILDSEIGFCTNAMERLCDRQEKLNILEKWSYLRPQVPDITTFNRTYLRIKTKLELVKHNKIVKKEDSRFTREYELQLNALNQYYKYKFQPEYKILKETIKSVGINTFVTINPHLKSIINEIEKVEKLELECQEWIVDKILKT